MNAMIACVVATQFAAAMQEFEEKRAAEIAYDQAFWMPAHQVHEAGGAAIPDEVSTEMERLTGLRDDAEEALIATPAPTLSDVIWKMEHAKKRWEDFCGWPDTWWNAVLSDLRRIDGGAA